MYRTSFIIFYYNLQITNREVIIKYWVEIGEITYYRRYVDDIVIIFDQNKINEVSVTKYVNNMHKYLEFKLTEEEIKKITI
jgi:DNA-binding CsgD family transcriptional regulator